MEAGHDEQGMGTRDLVGGGAAPDSEIDDNRDRGETPVGIVDEEGAREEDDGTLLTSRGAPSSRPTSSSPR
jgi:hypothetical protein